MIAKGQSVAYVAQALGIREALAYQWKQRSPFRPPRGKYSFRYNFGLPNAPVPRRDENAQY